MTDQALDILKLVLLGLLYLFFARVLWAVWSEVRSANSRATRPAVGRRRRSTSARRPSPPTRRRRRRAKPAKGAAARRPARRRSSRRPGAGATFPLGARDHRSAATRRRTITHRRRHVRVAAPHLRIYDVDGQAMVEDLGSTNGSFHNGNRLIGARLLHPGDRIQVGYTVLEAQ